MPVYEYQCATCDTRFEELVRGGSMVVACPQCTSTDLQKLLSTFQRSRGGGDMPVRAGAPAPRSGGCGGGGCGCH